MERLIEKRYHNRDQRKRKRMKVSGKSVFALQRLMAKNPKISKKK